MNETSIQELKFASQSIQQEIGKTEKSYQEEFSSLGKFFFSDFCGIIWDKEILTRPNRFKSPSPRHCSKELLSTPC